MKWLAVFAAMAVTDYLYASWSAAVTSKRAASAAATAAGIVLCGAFTITEYVSNAWLVVPAAAGAALGTYLSVKRTK
jgi:hypothetical protein